MSSWFPPPPLKNPKSNLPLQATPIPFNPLDISGCALWLDASDTSTVDVNGDLSGVNVNRVMKWFDKANPSNQNYWTHDGDPATSGLYNTHKVNQRNVIYFPPTCYMDHEDGGVSYAFKDRSFFAAIKCRSSLMDASATSVTIFNGVDASGMTLGIFPDISNTSFLYRMGQTGGSALIEYDVSETILNRRMILAFVNNSTDLSGNAGIFDITSETLTTSGLADYNTNKMQYELNNRLDGGSQDICELIMYDTALSEADRNRVINYLGDKWCASGEGYTFPEDSGFVSTGLGGLGVFAYTYIIYGAFVEGEFPNWYWCDENRNVETPPVLADGYDGTTALRDGLAVVVSGTFYA